MKSEMAEVKLAKLCIEMMQERFKGEGSHKGDTIVGVRLVGNGVQPVYKKAKPKFKLAPVQEARERVPERRRFLKRAADAHSMGTWDTRHLPVKDASSPGVEDAYVIRMVDTYTYSVWMTKEKDWLRSKRGGRRAWTYVVMAENAMWEWECKQAVGGK